MRDGKRSRHENVTPAHLADASDDALRNLATSWGPFQLMGYKCILLDVNIRDIRGPTALSTAPTGSTKPTGSVMRQGRYRDCFHMHNTGQPYPKTGLPRTHDPQYVPRGMAMMKQFVPPTAHASSLSMPANKYALLRYRIIDRCLTNPGKPFPTKEELRQACEEALYGSDGEHISISTVEKDLWAMRNEADLGYYAPIEYHRDERGYHYTEEGYSINDVQLNDDDLDAIRFATNTLIQFRDLAHFPAV